VSTRSYYPPSNSPKEPFRKKPPKFKRKARGLLVFFGLVGVALLSASAGAFFAISIASTPLMQSKLSPEEQRVFNQGDRISSGSNFQMPELTRPVSILLLGVKVLTSDVNQPPANTQQAGYQALVNSFEGLSDTMLLLRFDPESHRVIVLSVPRDTRTEVEGIGVTKLNEANSYGGPALAATSVSNLLGGIAIDRYIRINVQGVEKLVDTLGGVTVYVPHDMHYQDDSQHLYIDLKQGEHHLNGNQVLQFLRFRHDRYGDIGRIQRQQMLMRALLEQSLNPLTIARIPQILSVIKENIDTNLSVEELVALVGFASQTDRSEVQMLMLPGQFSSPSEYSASYWLPNADRIRDLVSQYFYDQSTAPEAQTPGSLRIAIQDSTGDAGAMNQVTTALAKAGYRDVFADDSSTQRLSSTRIIAQDGDRQNAEAIRAALGLGEIRVESTGSLDSDITIQLGEDWSKTQNNAPQ